MADVRFEPAAWPPSIRQRNCPCARATAAPCQKLKCRRRMSGAKNIGNAMPSLRVLAGRFHLGPPPSATCARSSSGFCQLVAAAD